MTGQTISHYRILEKIGEGGMGVVYRAEDTKLRRTVALKFLPGHADRERFVREAQAAAALNHPNICTIFEIDDQHGFLAMEHIEGQSLREKITERPLPLKEALDIVMQVCQGLQAAHEKGVVHRDIKPANLMLTAQGQAKIMDFGLAQVGDRSRITQAGIALGTPAYMSPEQAQGQPTDRRTDVWSLGVVLYEMLTGRVPFAGDREAAIAHSILNVNPEPPTALRSGLTLAIDRLIDKALAKDPAHRYQHADDLLADLRRVPITRDTRSPSSPDPGRILKWSLPIVAVLAAILIYWFNPFGKPTGSIAVLPFVNASGNPDMEYLGDGITESLINSLSQVPNLTVMSRNSVFRYKGREIDAQAAGETLKVQAVLTGRVAQRGNSLSISAELTEVRSNRHLWGQQYNRKLADILAVQEEISTEISENLRFKLTGEEKKRLTQRYTQNTEAYQLYLQGRYHWYKKTPDGFNKGIEYFLKAIAVDPNYAPAYAGLAALYNNLANFNFAILPPRDAWAKAKAAAEKAVQIDDSLAAAHTSLALVAYQWEWNWSNAEKEFKRSLEIDPSSSSTYEPSPSSTHHWYAHYLMTMGRTQESFSAARRALELDPLDLATNAHQGWHYLYTRQYDGAIEPLRKTVEMDPNFALAHAYLGQVYEQKGAFGDAITHFQNCVRITGGRPTMTALLGHGYAAANRQGEAQAILQQLITLSKQKYVPPYPIAVIYAALGQKEEAFSWLEKAYDTRDSWMDYLGQDPRLDGLRSDPRFANLLRRMNLAR